MAGRRDWPVVVRRASYGRANDRGSRLGQKHKCFLPAPELSPPGSVCAFPFPLRPQIFHEVFREVFPRLNQSALIARIMPVATPDRQTAHISQSPTNTARPRSRTSGNDEGVASRAAALSVSFGHLVGSQQYLAPVAVGQSTPTTHLPRFRLERRYHVHMIQRPKLLQMSRAARSAVIATIIVAGIFLTVFTLPADARGGHGFGVSGRHGAEFAGGHRHRNDSYIKAASDEGEKLLNSRLKSICSGC